MAGPEAPLASGSLAETPFVHLILYLYRQSGGGTLHVRGEAGAVARVRVRNGRPAAVRSSEGGTDLKSALLPLCGWRGGDFLFYGSDNLEQVDAADEAIALGRTLTGSLDPYALLYASLRDHARDDMVDSVLERYPSAQLTAPVDRDVGRLGLDDADQAVVTALRQAPASIASILERHAALPAQHVRRLLYALLVTHMLTPEDERQSDLYKSQIGEEDPPSAAPTRPTSPSSDRPSGPSPTNSSSGMREPPSRTPHPIAPPKATSSGSPPQNREPTPVAGSVNEVASAAMPAWQVLMSLRDGAGNSESGRPKVNTTTSPQRVVASLRPPGTSATSGSSPGTPGLPAMRPPGPLPGSMTGAMAGAMSDPAMRRKRAEQFLQTSRFAEALALFDELVTADPKDAKLQGMRARSLFEVHRADANGLPRTVVEAVRKTHELDADEPQAHYVKGLVYKHSGDLAKAMACWKRALASDPKNLEAERELRLARLRNT